MKTLYKYQEKTLSMATYEKIPDLAILGGIEIEHIIEINNNKTKIKTEVGGPGGRLAIYLKDHYFLTPSILSFLGNDEYMDLIIKTLNTRQISIIWAENPKGNTRKVRNLEENKEYLDSREENLKIDPDFLAEYLYNIKNIFISYNSWNEKIIELLNTKNRKVYVDVREDKISENSQFSCDFVFLVAENNFKELQEKTKNIRSDNKIILTKDVLSFQNKVLEIKINQKKYFEEAVSAYEANFINCIIKGSTLKNAHDWASNLYIHVLECGSIPKEKL